MRTAAGLLAAARSVAALRSVVAAAGLDVSSRVDADRLGGLDLDASAAELVGGPGTVRVLILQFRSDSRLRDSLQRLARHLASRAPHVLWIVVATEPKGATAAIAGLSGSQGALRVACFLWEPDHVVDSDAETLCALAAVRADEDVTYHARCMEVLGREALTRRFYRSLESQVAALAGAVPGVSAEDARGIALLYASRLLFLCFLEAKGWLDGDRAFLATQFDACMRAGGQFHRRVLLPLFFGTLNTPISRRTGPSRLFGRVPFLNGGLFTRTPLERRAGRWRFSDERLGALLAELFQRFRFVAREDTATWSEASVDPEMLGRAFESLMAASERRASGVYYTPHALVARVSEQALAAVLPGGGTAGALRVLRSLRVLDPACGSGAFLVYVLERVAALRHECGERASLADIRRDVLARSVFGVDRNPTAVWLCELRLWLAVVIESEERDPLRVPALPNLDRNIRVGDALAGAGFSGERAALAGGARVEALRQRYVRATGARKQTLARALDREERGRVVAHLDREIGSTRHARAELLSALRARDLFGERAVPPSGARRDLKRLRDRLRELRVERRRVLDGGALPFSFGAVFAEAQSRGGFDVVLGNPPWVRLHRIPVALRILFKRQFAVYRDAGWRAGAAAARAAPGFAGQVDLAALFAERSVTLLRDGGALSLLLPVKLWRSLAGGGLRRFLSDRASLLRLEDLTDWTRAFDAAVYPSLLVARAGGGRPAATVVAIHRSAEAKGEEWTVPASGISYDASPGAPWIILPPRARAGFERLRAAGAPLSTTHFGAARLGVKSGCNAAFLVRVTDSARGIASVVNADGEHGSVELDLLRPALRGDHVIPWTRPLADEWIVWTHDERGAPLARLPDRARAWLRRRYDDLAQRSDASHARRWWSLFRVEAAAASAPRVVWADFGRRPRALVLPLGDPTVPLNTCYVLSCPDERDAWALAALLNSRIAAAWLNALAEPARGGYRRYLGWTVGQLPLPRDWTRARDLLCALRGADEDAVTAGALRAYGVRHSEVAALLEAGE
jgi:hypothetical protein